MLQRLADDPILAVIVGALLTWLVHSSVAMVLLVISLTSAAMLSAPLGMALVLGANIGSGLIPIGLSLALARCGEARAVRQFRLPARRRARGAPGPVVSRPTASPRLESDPARQIANFHTLFNLALALVFLPSDRRRRAAGSSA